MRDCLKKISNKIQTFFRSTFERWGGLVYDYPHFMIIPTTLLIPLFIYGNIIHQIENSPQVLWIPPNAQSLSDLDEIEDIFEEIPEPNGVFVRAKNKDQGLLTINAFQEMLDYQKGFMSQVIDGGYSFDDICYKGASKEDECLIPINPLLFFMIENGEYDLSRVSSDSELVDLIQSGRGQPELYPEGTQNFIFIQIMFGSTTPEDVTTNSDGTNNISYAYAARWSYELKNQDNPSEYRDYHQMWQDFSENFNLDSEYIQVLLLTRTSIQRSLDQNLADNQIFVYIGVAIIITWCIVTIMKLNTYESRTFVAGVGVGCVMIAWIGSIALGTFFGLKGSIVTGILPYFLLGIGVDDMYVLLFYLDQAPKEMTPRQRMIYMMKNAGVSITITSFTNCFSFAMGSISSMNAIRSFCLFAVLGMLLDYIYQITLFSAVLACDLRRTEKNLGDWWGLIYCKPKSKACCSGKYIYNEDGTPKEPLLRKFLRDKYSPFLMKPITKIVVGLIYLVILGVSIYGAAQLQIDINYEWFVQDGDYVADTIELRDDNFDDIYYSMGIYTLQSDFSKTETQNLLKELQSELNECKGCDEQWTVEGSAHSWYSVLNDFVGMGGCITDTGQVSLNQGTIPENNFFECLQQWLETDGGRLYKIYISLENEQIEGAHMKVTIKKNTKSVDQIQFASDIRDICDSTGPDNTYPYHFFLEWADHFDNLIPQTTLSIGLSMAVIGLITFVMLGDALGAFIVLLVSVSVFVCLLGLMYFWGLHLNTVTLVNVIVSIGIAVDYSTHIVEAFLVQKGTKDERTIKALGEVGQSVFNAGVSTFLCILVIGLSESYVFRVFFKCWFGIILFSFIFSFCLTPVLLSIIGPSEKDLEQKKISSIEEEMVQINPKLQQTNVEEIANNKSEIPEKNPPS